MKIIGAPCKKHPELGGLRLARVGRAGHCVACSAEAGKRYYEANKERLRAEHRQYAVDNREKNIERGLKWAKDNPERHAKRSREWYQAHPERARAFTATWVKNNLHRCAERESKKRLTVKHAVPVWANHFYIREIYDLARRRTKLLQFPWHVDHIVPLKSPLVCGLHCEQNLRVVPGADNSRKGNRQWPDMPHSLRAAVLV